MKISSIDLTNFRGIGHLHLNLDTKSTVIFGINGVGKSTILRSIDLLYANIIGKLLNSSKRLVELEKDDILRGKSRASIKAVFRFESEKEFEYSRSISKLQGIRHSINLAQLSDYFEEQYITNMYEDDEGNLIVPEDLKNMPIFVNYGVNRLVADISLKATKQGKYEKMNVFDKAIDNKMDFSALFEWFRLKEDLENQEKVRIDMEYEDRELKAVREAMLAMFEGFEHIHVERQPLTMLVEKQGVSLNLNQLSDGEKCTMALFGDLARRLAMANPARENPLEGSGVVLIDEVELHMHTQWQRKILAALKAVFPNIQFIITTHSPQVLGETGKDYNILMMKKEENGEIEVVPYKSLYGWDSNAILEETMETSSQSLVVKELIKKMFEALESKSYDSAEIYADMIDDFTEGRNDSVAKVRVLIARGKRYEKDKKM